MWWNPWVVWFYEPASKVLVLPVVTLLGSCFSTFPRCFHSYSFCHCYRHTETQLAVGEKRPLTNVLQLLGSLRQWLLSSDWWSPSHHITAPWANDASACAATLLPQDFHGFEGVADVRRKKNIPSASEGREGKEPCARKLTDIYGQD